MAPTALELTGISKRFGAVTALDEASLRVESGTLHVVLGENGAGKTTLLRIAAGLERADSGEIAINGHSVPAGSSGRGAAISVVQQHFSLVPAMTVAENVALGVTGGSRWFQPARAAQHAAELAERAGFSLDPHARVSTLSVAAQQRLEVVKAIARQPDILVLDEPTAVLAPSESDALFAWLRRFVAGGRTVIVITHHLREAQSHADALTVLRRGRTVRVGTPGDTDEAQLVSAIVGEDRTIPGAGSPSGTPRPEAGVVVAAANADVLRDGLPRLQGVTLTVRAGELLGVAGVEGAGQAELLRLLAGRLSPTRGSVVVAPRTAFIPEDRRRDAIIGEMSLSENVFLRDAGSARGTIDWRAVAAHTRAVIDGFDVRSGNPETPVYALSGGNQQRFVLARELADAPQAVVAESPTRGLDIRAAAATRDRLRAECERGAAVVCYSSDIDELLAISDRVIVCHRGRVREVERSTSAIGAAMVAGP